VLFNAHEGPGAMLQDISVVNGDGWNAMGDPGDGGAIYCEDACPRIVRCIFHNNVGYGGGAILCFLNIDLPAGLPGDRVRITGCAFSDNATTSTAGGALLFWHCPAEVDSCVFSGNAASVAGALFVQDLTDSTLIRGCTFHGNSAEQQGGAIWRCGEGIEAVLAIESCTLYGNQSGNGVIYSDADGGAEGPLLLDRTIVAFNAAGALVCDGGTTPQLSCCDLYGNDGGDYGGCVAGQDGEDGNISEDPLFVDAAHGDFRLQLDSPCAPAFSGACGLIGSTGAGDVADVLSHDIGHCVLSVTDQGTLGFLDGDHSRGSGFIYPTGGANLLYIGSLWVGRDTSYVANRDYDADPGQDWAVSTDPDGRLRIEESGYSDQEFRGAYTDSGAASPLGLLVEQRSSAWGEDETQDDFVILHYAVANRSSVPLRGLYAGVFLDFDLSSSGRSDHGDTEPLLHLAYLTDASGICAGVCLLEDVPGGSPPGNLTLISNRTVVWPHSYVTDRDKFGFLSAGGPEYVVESASTPDDYSVMVSVGPFDLDAGEERVVSFAIVGGADVEALEQNARTARGVGSADVADEPVARAPVTRLLPGRPNPFRGSAQISFHLAQPGEVKLSVYDASGRLVRTLAHGRYSAAPQTVTWDSRDETGHAVANGIYFAKLRAGASEQQQRLVLLR